MFDTLHLKIHNLEKYGKSAKALVRNSKNGRSKVFENPENLDNTRGTDDAEILKMVYHDSANFIVLSHWNSLALPSHHYDLAYHISWEKDFIEFNFSIPKYKWGTNIIQYISYFDQSEAEMYNLLHDFVKEFIRNPMVVDTIDLEDVEIFRFDFCYNQFFPTKKDALKYLQLQSQKMKKYGFKHKENITAYGNETVMIKTDMYSFKIYHKGTEFKKHDYPKIVEKGNPKGYNLQDLIDKSERILRYELSIRHTFMNRLFREMYFHKTGRTVKTSPYRYLYHTLRVDGIDRKVMKIKKFTLKSMHDVIPIFKKSDPVFWWQRFVGYDRVTLDKRMFHNLYKFFWNYVNKFQIGNSISATAFDKKLKLLNDMVNVKNMVKQVKLPKKNLTRLKMYAMISTEKPLSELRRNGSISKATYYRLLKDFKTVGIDEFNPDVATIKPSTDYQEYKSYFGRFHIK